MTKDEAEAYMDEMADFQRDDEAMRAVAGGVSGCYMVDGCSFKCGTQASMAETADAEPEEAMPRKPPGTPAGRIAKGGTERPSRLRDGGRARSKGCRGEKENR